MAAIKVGKLGSFAHWLGNMDGGVAGWSSNSTGGVEVDDRAGGAVDLLGSALGRVRVARGVVEHRLGREAWVVFLDVGGLVVGHGREAVGSFASHENSSSEKEDDDGEDNKKKT